MHWVAEILVQTESPDLISALLARDWAAVGGWGLFIGLVMTIMIGAFREWWVPAPAMRRLVEQIARQDAAADKLTEANLELRKQNTMLIEANRITEHFFAETTPKYGEKTE